MIRFFLYLAALLREGQALIRATFMQNHLVMQPRTPALARGLPDLAVGVDPGLRINHVGKRKEQERRNNNVKSRPGAATLNQKMSSMLWSNQSRSECRLSQSSCDSCPYSVASCHLSVISPRHINGASSRPSRVILIPISVTRYSSV